MTAERHTRRSVQLLLAGFDIPAQHCAILAAGVHRAWRSEGENLRAEPGMRAKGFRALGLEGFSVQGSRALGSEGFSVQGFRALGFEGFSVQGSRA